MNDIFLGWDNTFSYWQWATCDANANQHQSGDAFGLIQAGNWYHFVTVISPPLANSNGQLANYFTYVNGQLYTSVNQVQYPPALPRVNSFLGRSGWSADNYFTGEIDTINIYSTSLSDTQIYNLYTAAMGITSTPSTSTGGGGGGGGSGGSSSSSSSISGGAIAGIVIGSLVGVLLLCLLLWCAFAAGTATRVKKDKTNSLPPTSSSAYETHHDDGIELAENSAVQASTTDSRARCRRTRRRRRTWRSNNRRISIKPMIWQQKYPLCLMISLPLFSLSRLTFHRLVVPNSFLSVW